MTSVHIRISEKLRGQQSKNERQVVRFQIPRTILAVKIMYEGEARFDSKS